MRGLCFALFLSIWGAMAAAQTVEVRAGEHDSFTRLVFYLPERMSFDLDRTGDAVDMRLGRSGLTLDTSVVFQRVPKTRLTAIGMAADDGPVRLTLACDCEIRTFWHGENALVLDIADSSRPESRSESRGGSEPAPDGGAAVMLKPLPLSKTRPSSTAKLVARALDWQMGTETDDAQDSEILRASREQLLKQLGRAASQGLLTPRITLLNEKPRPGSRQETARSQEAETDIENPGAADTRPGLQIRAESSIDRDMRTVFFSGLGGVAGQACLDPELVNVRAWAGKAPFPQQIGGLRAGLVGEFDKPNAAAVTALARFYVHFGFGAEARQVLAQMGSDSEADRVLAAMTAIVETGHAGPGSALAGQMECEPMTALWSALSYPALPADEPLDTDAVLYGFSALPPQLRAHLGPALARRFIDAGYSRDGERVHRILRRSDATMTPEATLLGADMALTRGETENAEATLDTIIADNSAPSAEALLRLINARLRRGADISYETAQLAGAYAKEYRDQPLGAALARAHLMALAVSGAFDEAFVELGRLMSKGGAEGGGLRSTLVGVLTERADDYDFLRHVTDDRTDRPGRLDHETANDVAERLLVLGFLAEAESFITADATGPASRERKLIRAEIALRNMRPRQAEAELLELDGEDADLLRARARSMAGDHDAAHVLFAAAGQADAARRESWLGSDWQALAKDDNPTFSAMADLKLRGDDPPGGPDEGVLARNRGLLEQSRELRMTVDALLAASPTPDPQAGS